MPLEIDVMKDLGSRHAFPSPQFPRSSLVPARVGSHPPWRGDDAEANNTRRIEIKERYCCRQRNQSLDSAGGDTRFPMLNPRDLALVARRRVWSARRSATRVSISPSLFDVRAVPLSLQRDRRMPDYARGTDARAPSIDRIVSQRANNATRVIKGEGNN